MRNGYRFFCNRFTSTLFYCYINNFFYFLEIVRKFFMLHITELLLMSVLFSHHSVLYNPYLPPHNILTIFICWIIPNRCRPEHLLFDCFIDSVSIYSLLSHYFLAVLLTLLVFTLFWVIWFPCFQWPKSYFL